MSAMGGCEGVGGTERGGREGDGLLVIVGKMSFDGEIYRLKRIRKEAA